MCLVKMQCINLGDLLREVNDYYSLFLDTFYISQSLDLFFLIFSEDISGFQFRTENEPRKSPADVFLLRCCLSWLRCSLKCLFLHLQP